MQTIWLLRKHVADDSVVVYPENISGNPLGAKNVVRWFLHNPGHFTGNHYEYGSGELYFRYATSVANNFVVPNGSHMSKTIMTIHSPPKEYCLKGVSPKRQGSAYLIRKGAGKPIVHDLTDSICIDGMTHAETAAVFKRVKTFISYDPLTAYSTYAILCGCRSVVMFSDDERKKYGYDHATSVLCDGLDDYSNFTRENYERVRAETDMANESSREKTRSFVNEVKAYFSL